MTTVDQIRDQSSDEIAGLSIGEILSQARALCSDSLTTEIITAKRRDLRKLSLVDDGRRIITDVAERHRKMAVETGWDIRTGLDYGNPLEAWTCSNAPAARLMYQRIALAEDGTYSLADFTSDADLEHLDYMKDERLISFGASGAIHMLSDPDAADNSSRYPGAPMPDHKASVGRQLRQHGRELVLAAIWRIRHDRAYSKIHADERAQIDRENGAVGLPIRLVCGEANAGKARMRSLDGHRYLSVDTCGRILRELLAAGLLEEQEPPRAIRTGRRWIMRGRTFVAESVDRIPGPIAYMGRDSLPPRLVPFGELTAVAA